MIFLLAKLFFWTGACKCWPGVRERISWKEIMFSGEMLSFLMLRSSEDSAAPHTVGMTHQSEKQIAPKSATGTSRRRGTHVAAQGGEVVLREASGGHFLEQGLSSLLELPLLLHSPHPDWRSPERETGRTHHRLLLNQPPFFANQCKNNLLVCFLRGYNFTRRTDHLL